MSVAARVWLIITASTLLPHGVFAQSADLLEGVVVREIRVTGLRKLAPDVVEQHLATRVGEPFHRATLARDRRRLDELRLFTEVIVEPRLENQGVVLDVAVSETLRVLPVVVVRVTDENGVSAGPGLRTINLLGHAAQAGLSVRFGGETAVAATVDSTTITPGTLAWHLGFSDSKRRNTIYDFDEHATTADVRLSRNWRHGLRTGLAADVMAIDTGSSGVSLSPDGTDVIPTIGLFVTLDTLDSSTDPRAGTWAELQVDRLFGDARSWTVTLDGRRFQRLSDWQGLGLFSLATLQTGTVGVDLPEYLQFALGGGNSIRGWELEARRGRNQFIGALEYTYVALPVRPFSVAGLNLYAGVQVVGFADVGLAWNDSDDFRAASAIDGYGVGLRMLVPFVDVIRLDLAWGEPGRGAFAYFGVSLKAARQRQRVR
jgi:outer membrane protein assembly factor BamA